MNRSWVLLDTETTGFSAPIFVVEIAAQKMIGWKPVGPPFRRLLNHGTAIPPEASRVHGYTKEILERDGDAPYDVYDDFAEYAEELPLVAYNLPYDLDKVLLPEWERLGIETIGQRGFCALALTQRLLDPVPAGNCKLQTLRQYYRLPERGAHTALGDVETVIDLMAKVIQPLAEERGLSSWDDICAFAQSVWYPARIAFGKHKGRDYREALDDADFRSWLSWLASSDNTRSASMGKWYLDALEHGRAAKQSPFYMSDEQAPKTQNKPGGTDIESYLGPEIAVMEQMIETARTRLADLSASYMRDRRAADTVSSALFLRLRADYKRRDDLKLRVEYRQKYIDVLLSQGDESAEEVVSEFEDANDGAEREYEDASQEAAKTKPLNDEQAAEAKSIWQKLVHLFHPDKVANNPEQQQAYENLLAIINDARDTGNITLLREIADDPDGFMQRHGWASLSNLKSRKTLHTLNQIYESISLQILNVIQETDDLRSGADFSVFVYCKDNEGGFEELVANRKKKLGDEIHTLIIQANALRVEIETLTDSISPI